MIKCEASGHVPKGDHYAVVEFTRISGRYPDDDAVPVQRYTAFTDRRLWEEHVRELVMTGRTDFVAISARRAEIRTEVSLDLNP